MNSLVDVTRDSLSLYIYLPPSFLFLSFAIIPGAYFEKIPYRSTSVSMSPTWLKALLSSLVKT